MGAIGARPAGACTCERAATENQKVLGNTCACGKRAAGMLFFSLPTPATPSLGDVLPQLRRCVACTLLLGHLLINAPDACSCEKAADGGLLPTETDFTTKS